MKPLPHAVLAVLATVFLLACDDGGLLNQNDEAFCSNSDDDRCFDAGCTDGSNYESPNASSASCTNECRPAYCDGYCACENYIYNSECAEC